jgi:hypothetical protein
MTFVPNSVTIRPLTEISPATIYSSASLREHIPEFAINLLSLIGLLSGFACKGFLTESFLRVRNALPAEYLRNLSCKSLSGLSEYDLRRDFCSRLSE